MKKQLFILTLIGLTTFTKAQDQLFKKDNSKLLVKITEVSPDEIKYKLYNNLNGPTYVVLKSEVSLLIYENGQYEVINSSPASVTYQPQSLVLTPRPVLGMSKADSLKYYKYSSSLSINFLNFFNNEVGLIYQKDFLKNNFNIIIPLAIGIQSPAVTQSVYFSNTSGSINLDRKLFEAGFGINYYPSLKFPVNYYIGPTFRYMQYDCQQNYIYALQNNPITITKNGTLSRYCISITNGFIFRTKSRITLNMFGSIGFKNDILSTKIVDPVTNIAAAPLTNSFNLYFWSGFTVGFAF